jgi:GTP-binding protein
LKIIAEFVTSAAGASGFPGDELPEIALVGRSNVGKSSLINALTRQRIARVSAAPGKTRLANVYRVARGGGGPMYLVDLPGYGYARGGAASASDFAALTREYFVERLRPAPTPRTPEGRPERSEGRAEDEHIRGEASAKARGGGGAPPPLEKKLAALLLIDARHPGLASDRAAWRWLQETVAGRAIVATKVDKLARGQRIRALGELESVFEDPVLPCSAVTGEGLDELWNLIDTLANNRNPPRRRNRNSPPPRKATAPRPPRK